MPPDSVTIAAEGDVDAQIVRRILVFVGLNPGPAYVQRGKNRLDKHLRAYNNAARFAYWLVLRDMDRDAPCPSEMVQRILPAPASKMILRIAVRSVEAWLLADRGSISQFLGVSTDLVPLDPESLIHPKTTMINLARRSSRRTIREDMVPETGMSCLVGPGYTARITEFANNLWRPDIAAQRSRSLSRCIQALKRLL